MQPHEVPAVRPGLVLAVRGEHPHQRALPAPKGSVEPEREAAQTPAMGLTSDTPKVLSLLGFTVHHCSMFMLGVQYPPAPPPGEKAGPVQ